MKESQCLLHLQRLFWTPFCLYFSARRPREILAAVRARASRDDTICSKNRNFDPYHRDKARSRAYGLLPLWLLMKQIKIWEVFVSSVIPYRGSYRGGLWHDSRTKKITNHGSRILKFYFPESRK